jgi:hypothetical protein
MNRSITRRRFLAQATWGPAGAMILCSAASARSYQANEQIRCGLVGCGGRGQSFLTQTITALCDADGRRAAGTFKRLPDVPKFEDFRVMLDKMHHQIDAVIICTPDHTHAVAASAAIRLGKHVYCEKPLTRTVHEARTLTELAAQHKVVTQMGNQGGYNVRAVEHVRAGALGEIRQVHLQGEHRTPHAAGGPRPYPTGTHQVPAGLNWDLWVGPSAARPYHPLWMTPEWRIWRDFSTGDLGGWGPHLFCTVYKALKVGDLWKANEGAERQILRVTAEPTKECPEGVCRVNFPYPAIIHWDVPARGDMPPVRFTYTYSEEGWIATVRKLFEEHPDWGNAEEFRSSYRWRCEIWVGEKGLMRTTGHGSSNMELMPDEPFKDIGNAPESLSRPLRKAGVAGWTEAIRGGLPPMCDFDFSGPFTEWYLLGNVATLFPGQTLEYDPVAGRIINNAEADQAARPAYREGWVL